METAKMEDHIVSARLSVDVPIHLRVRGVLPEDEILVCRADSLNGDTGLRAARLCIVFPKIAQKLAI
jgi:hypothetical protein